MLRRGLFLTAVSLICSLFLPHADAQDFRRALYRFMPVMRFDSNERFFPIRAKSITDNPGNKLERENGAFLAERNADGSGLNLGYLVGIPPIDTGVYPHIIQAVLETDRLNESGNTVSEAHDVADRFQSSSAYRDRIYGHVIPRTVDGTLKGAWLQYWFFYYYNDFPAEFNLGDHEGDWEMIQVFVNTDLEPQVAVYAQHDSNSFCPWDKVRKLQGRPLVFVAKGSHASYFTPGQHDFGPIGILADVTDGQVARSIKVIRVGTKRPRWINWPGKWGASGSSPKGPSQHHGQWDEPQQFYENAGLDGDCK